MRSTHVTPSNVLGVLVTSTPIRVLEMSKSGCLLECNRRFDVGASGEFRVEINGREFSEELRITRCQRIEGSGSTYRVGAEFLLTRRAGARSLRSAWYATLSSADEPLSASLGLVSERTKHASKSV